MANRFEKVDVRVDGEILTLRVPKGTSDADIKKFVAQQGAPEPETAVATLPRPGPLGIVPPETRAEVGRSLEEITGGIPLFGELPEGIRSFPQQLALPTLGTAAGAGLGMLTGPAAPLAVPVLAGLGGFVGETLSQELGFTPESKFGRIMAATGPAIGPLFGKFQKFIKKSFGFIVSKSPPARAALARITLGDAVKESKSLGAAILEKQKGLLKKPSKVLFRAARMAKAPITADDLVATRSSLTLLKKEAADFRAFPEGRQIIRTIQQIESDLFPPVKRVQGVLPDLTAVPPRAKEVTTETLIRSRQLVGASIKRLDKEAGVKLGASKKFFAGLSKDVDRLIKGGGPKGKAAGLGKIAGKRAKLQFAVSDLEETIRDGVSVLQGEGDAVVLDGKKVLDSLLNLTDPKSKLFNENVADALKDEMPDIIDFFVGVNKIKMVGPGGPGSIVYRGITAAAGAKIGNVLGPPGAIAGAFVGAQGPEMITSLLLTPGGRKFLSATAKAGTGTVNDLHWAVLGQFLAQTVTPRESVQAGPDMSKLSSILP